MDLGDIYNQIQEENIGLKGLNSLDKRRGLLNDLITKAKNSSEFIYCELCLDLKKKSEFYSYRYRGTISGKCKKCLNLARQRQYARDSDFREKEKKRTVNYYHNKLVKKYEPKSS